jgi:hypothetical protein
LTSINPHLLDLIGVQNLIGLTQLADKTIPPDATVQLVGDAKAFLYDVPADHLFYRTVFDVNANPGGTSDDAWQLGWPPPNSSTIRVIDAPELRRFASTYYRIPLPSTSVMDMGEPTVR